MSRPSQFDALNAEPAKVPLASRLLCLASKAFQVTVVTLATVVAGLYVFPLQ
ncbi:MAG: hypothetical protein JSS14_10900 [Proteobacteria bacterium]|nr:hypothetical protein [Pseudomonadota bacterium]